MSSSVQSAAPPAGASSPQPARTPTAEGDVLILIPVLICVALLVYVFSTAPPTDARPTVSAHCASAASC